MLKSDVFIIWLEVYNGNSNNRILLDEIKKFLCSKQTILSIDHLKEEVSNSTLSLHELNEFRFLFGLDQSEVDIMLPNTMHYDMTKFIAASKLLGLSVNIQSDGLIHLDVDFTKTSYQSETFETAITLLTAVDMSRVSKVEQGEMHSYMSFYDEFESFSIDDVALHADTSRVQYHIRVIEYLEKLSNQTVIKNNLKLIVEKIILNSTFDYQNAICHALYNFHRNMFAVLMDLNTNDRPFLNIDHYSYMCRQNTQNFKIFINEFSGKFHDVKINPFAAIIHAMSHHPRNNVANVKSFNLFLKKYASSEIRLFKDFLRDGQNLCSQEDITFLSELSCFIAKLVENTGLRGSKINYFETFLSKFTKKDVQTILTGLVKSLHYLSYGCTKLLKQIDGVDKSGLASIFLFVSHSLGQPKNHDDDLSYFHEIIQIYCFNNLVVGVRSITRPLTAFIMVLDKMGFDYVGFKVVPRSIISVLSHPNVDFKFIDYCDDYNVVQLILHHLDKIKRHAKRYGFGRLVNLLDFLKITDRNADVRELSDSNTTFRNFCIENEIDFTWLSDFNDFVVALNDMGVMFNLGSDQIRANDICEKECEETYANLVSDTEKNVLLKFFNSILFAIFIERGYSFVKNYQCEIQMSTHISNIIFRMFQNFKHDAFRELCDRTRRGPSQFIKHFITEEIENISRDVNSWRSVISFIDVFDVALSEHEVDLISSKVYDIDFKLYDYFVRYIHARKFQNQKPSTYHDNYAISKSIFDLIDEPEDHELQIINMSDKKVSVSNSN